jgi:glutamate synthase domain-containing protein 2
VGLGIRKDIKLIASGKLISAFDMCRVFALGADSCNVARGFMFALGCIQAQTCHTGKCPTGVTTQDPGRYKALVVEDKSTRVANFHKNTMTALREAVESSGLSHPTEFTPHHLMIRINSREARSAASQYLWLETGALETENVVHPAFAKYWGRAQSGSFASVI